MTEPTEPKASAKQGHTHRHDVTPHTGTAPFSSTTHHVLDWLTDQGLCPLAGGFWSHPRHLTVDFGTGSGWLWGHVTISGKTGWLGHLKAFWTDHDGTQRLDTADGPTAIRAELQRHGEHRIQRITQLAARHGLTTIPTTGDTSLADAVAALDTDTRARLLSALRNAAAPKS